MVKQISLKKNIITSYFSQGYVVLLGIIVLPFYISEMGAEAYGLVGFFAMLQSWFNLLDLGLTPTIGRETARMRAGKYDNITYRRLFRSLNIIFVCVAVIGGVSLLILSGLIAEKWLHVERLSISEVSFALKIMIISIALRWMTGLYRGVVSGSEQFVWLSGFNVIIATLRFLIVFPVMWLFGATPTVFFSYQFIVAIIEFSGLLIKAKNLLPKLTSLQAGKIGWSIKPIKSIIGFSISIALTSGIWVLVTQTDKLIMSNLLTLENYGYFTLAVLVASGIMMITAPISSAIMPRMVKLEADGKYEELIRIYRHLTQIVTVIAGSVAIILSSFTVQILYVWTGDRHIAEVAAPIMQLYAIGYGILAVAAFPYYLQYAKGSLKLHIYGSVLFVIILLPVLFWATHQYGMIGAGYAWLFVNFLYFMIWTLIVHNTFAKGIHSQWLFHDIFVPIALPIVVGILLHDFVQDGTRIILLLKIFGASLIIITSAILSSRIAKDHLLKIILRKYL
ncbi:MAG: oligosaccharide flippase family protein [Sulfuricurvum sp.]|jgi:O-antigen/teichoic acid export membrane protein|uniref:lipopolysaccharide biosynthesis protein n=1 Tax=Sulfuricurvum sp. TaxID=2025608 RepID=UPI0025E98C8C|nr:oligosaccharide flippase family protein [Sulfuricurvum sp.]MCK9372277.1 oligosaccharide flippase family protein [Sulfuricurvum sp.]